MFRHEDIGDEPFVIAEVGQNHQGELDIAREYIRIFAFEGANAVKFQTRNNKYLFSKDAYEADYYTRIIKMGAKIGCLEYYNEI